MVLAVCVDDRYGMLFNRRRQSMDRAVRERLLELSSGGSLWMSEYSAQQFHQLPGNGRVCEDFLEQAGPGDVCFAEGGNIARWLPKCSKVILYCWNRVYPADTHFPAELLRDWTLTDSRDFPGNSHDTITEKIYEKKFAR